MLKLKNFVLVFLVIFLIHSKKQTTFIDVKWSSLIIPVFVSLFRTGLEKKLNQKYLYF